VMFFCTASQVVFEIGVFPLIQGRMPASWFQVLHQMLMLLTYPSLGLNAVLHQPQPSTVWWLVEVFVVNTLCGALLGWAAGKIWRAVKARRRGGESV
jgi:hypothetical protein